MPSIKSRKKNQKWEKSSSFEEQNQQLEQNQEVVESISVQKRRPSRDSAEVEFSSSVNDVSNVKNNHLQDSLVEQTQQKHESFTEKKSDIAKEAEESGFSSNFKNTQSSSASHFEKSSSDHQNRIHLNFPGQDIIKARFPKLFNVTEDLVNHWVTGDFENISIKHPILRLVTKKSLKKAKDVETKVLESPVTEKIFTKAFEVGITAQNQLNKIKSFFQKK